MNIFSVISLLGGLSMFLYGIEVMGDGLKNSSSAALKNVLEKVTTNTLMGVLTGTLVTAVIQSSTATIVLTVALIGAGVLNLKQAVSIVMVSGAWLPPTRSAWWTVTIGARSWSCSIITAASPRSSNTGTELLSFSLPLC